jgi:hypothetical protein
MHQSSVQMRDFAEPSALDHLAKVVHQGLIEITEIQPADYPTLPGFTGSFDNGFGVGQICSDGLLQQDVFASLKRGDGLLAVKMIRRVDDDDVNASG